MVLSLNRGKLQVTVQSYTYISPHPPPRPSTIKSEFSYIKWLRVTVSDSTMDKPDHNASSLRDPRVGLEWISSAVTNYFFHWHSFFSFFILHLSLLAKA